MNKNEFNSTTSSQTSEDPFRALTLISAYLNLVIIVLGLIGNTISFLVFRFHRSFKKMPSMVFLSFVAITDTLALFEWNLGHYFQLLYKIDLQYRTGCRLFYFAQYASIQVSALLLSIMCLDRYVTVVSMPGSFLASLPFRTIKSSFIWSVGIVGFVILLNVHLFFTVGRYIIFLF